jgi:hypothetical protein
LIDHSQGPEYGRPRRSPAPDGRESRAQSVGCTVALPGGQHVERAAWLGLRQHANGVV